jgi:hypothetical protein
MIDPEEIENVEEQVKQNPAMRTFVEESLAATALSNARGSEGEATVIRTGLEIAALWSLGLATLLVLRRLGLFGGSRKSQATDTHEASKKIAQAVNTLTSAGFSKEQAFASVNAMFEHAAERQENTSLIKALVGK